MTDAKWVGKFEELGVEELPDKSEAVVRTSHGSKSKRGKVDEQRERIERSFNDASGRTGRVERALRLWKAGMVQHEDEAVDDNGNKVEDVWQVASQTDKHQSYMVFEGVCMCEDKNHNGGQDCKHELAVLMVKGEEIDGIKYTL